MDIVVSQVTENRSEHHDYCIPINFQSNFCGHVLVMSRLFVLRNFFTTEVGNHSGRKDLDMCIVIIRVYEA